MGLKENLSNALAPLGVLTNGNFEASETSVVAESASSVPQIVYESDRKLIEGVDFVDLGKRNKLLLEMDYAINAVESFGSQQGSDLLGRAQSRLFSVISRMQKAGMAEADENNEVNILAPLAS